MSTTLPQNTVAHAHAEPMRRGLSGRLLYHTGMFLSRRGVRFEVRGLEHLPRQGSYILAANHETYVDGMWIMSCLPKPLFKRFCCIGAEDLLTRHGPFGRVIMRVGRGIPIKRRGNPIRALQSALEALRKDENILLIHPEGTRSRNGRLGRIQDGACFLARKAGVPIIPVFLDGAYEIFNRYYRLPSFRDKEGHKHRLIISFGKALQPEHFSSTKEMTAALRQWMETRFAHKEVPRDYSSLPVGPAKNMQSDKQEDAESTPPGEAGEECKK